MSLKSEDLVGIVKKHPVIVACGLISVGLLLSAFYRIDLLESKQSELETTTASALRVKTNLTNAEKLSEQLQGITSLNEVVNSRTIRPEELANNIQYFYRLESESGVKYSDLRPVGQAPASGSGKSFVAVNYTLAVRGSYPQVLGFLRLLERGAIFSRITSFVVNSGGSDAGAGEISVTMTVDLLGRP